MTLIFKSGAMAVLVALILGLLGFYDSVSQAKSDDANYSQVITKIAHYEARIKTKVQKLHKLDNGIQLYRFQYRNDPVDYVGVMADDLAANETFRSAVVNMGDGFYTVNYAKLGLQIITFENWKNEGPKAVLLSRDVALTE